VKQPADPHLSMAARPSSAQSTTRARPGILGRLGIRRKSVPNGQVDHKAAAAAASAAAAESEKAAEGDEGDIVEQAQKQAIAAAAAQGIILVKDLATGQLVRLDQMVESVDTFEKLKEPKAACRFAVGDFVQVYNGKGGWSTGQVLQLNVHDEEVNRQRNWLPHHVAPYQVKLSTGKVVYAPNDTDEIVRAHQPSNRRFKVGDHVECNIGQAVWPPGLVEEVDIMDAELNKRNKWPVDRRCPYKVKLFDGKQIFAPDDADDVIRAAAVPLGTREATAMPPLDDRACGIEDSKDVYVPKRRFGIGDFVQCYTQGALHSGVVLELNVRDKEVNRQSGWPLDHVAPYRVKLSTGKVIYLPADTEALIKRGVSTPRRFKVGDHVQCNVGEEVWPDGIVLEVDMHDPELNKRNDWPSGTICPYKVELMDGKMIYAPDDDTDVIRAAATVAAAEESTGLWQERASGPEQENTEQERTPTPEGEDAVVVEEEEEKETDQEKVNEEAIAELVDDNKAAEEFLDYAPLSPRGRRGTDDEDLPPATPRVQEPQEQDPRERSPWNASHSTGSLSELSDEEDDSPEVSREVALCQTCFWGLEADGVCPRCASKSESPDSSNRDLGNGGIFTQPSMPVAKSSSDGLGPKMQRGCFCLEGRLFG